MMASQEFVYKVCAQSSCREFVQVVRASPDEGKINRLNETFSAGRWRVAPCCGGGLRNIEKQKSFAVRPESPTRVGMAQPSPNIPVVEDDRETRTLIAKYLRPNAFNTTTSD